MTKFRNFPGNSKAATELKWEELLLLVLVRDLGVRVGVKGGRGVEWPTEAQTSH